MFLSFKLQDITRQSRACVFLAVVILKDMVQIRMASSMPVPLPDPVPAPAPVPDGGPVCERSTMIRDELDRSRSFGDVYGDVVCDARGVEGGWRGIGVEDS